MKALENQYLESIEKQIKDVYDKRFDTLKNSRLQWEDSAYNKIMGIATGSAPSPMKSVLVKIYTNLSDPTLPSLFKKNLVKNSAWIDKDFFKWSPDGVESVDIEGTYWITDWQKGNLNNELSNFHHVKYATLHQRDLLNIGAWSYSWMVKPKTINKYTANRQNGMIGLGGGQSQIVPLEYDLQGLRYEFVNVLNLYPDVISEVNYDNTNKLDLYYQHYKSYEEIKNCEKYNPESFYSFEDNVLYRGLDALERVDKNRGVTYSTVQMRLNKALANTGSESQTEQYKQQFDIRVCIVKELKIDGKRSTGDGNGFRLEYIRQGSEFYLLFAEKNAFPFEQKQIRVSRKWADPHLFYTDSESGMMINQHNYLVHSKQLQASALIQATNPTRLISTKFLDALQGNKDKIAKLLTEPGGIEYLDFEKLGIGQESTHLKPYNLNQEKALSDLQLFQDAIDKCKVDIAQSNIQATDIQGAGATAAYNRQMAAEQDLIATKEKYDIARDLIEPALRFELEMAKIAFQDQKVTSDINHDDKTYLKNTLNKYRKQALEEAGQEIPEEELEYEDIKELVAEKKQTIPRVTEIKGEEQIITYNPITDKKQTILNQVLFNNSQSSLKFELEDLEYSKGAKLEELVQLVSNLMANVPDSPFKYLFMKDSFLQAFQWLGMPNYQSLADEANKLFQEMIAPKQPTPEEQAMLASELQKNQADAQSKQATATKQTAEAQKINQEVNDNELAKQLIGV